MKLKRAAGSTKEDLDEWIVDIRQTEVKRLLDKDPFVLLTGRHGKVLERVRKPEVCCRRDLAECLSRRVISALLLRRRARRRRRRT